MVVVEGALPILIVAAGGAIPADLGARIGKHGVVVVGQATEAQLAARLCATRGPRAILLIVDDGRGAAFVTKLAAHGVPIVALARTPEAGVAALAAGAVEVLPEATSPAHVADSLRLMSSLRVIRRHDVTPRPSGRQRVPEEPPIAETIRRLVVIGSSTGGPQALAELLGRLPPDFPAPILVAQHMPVDYESQFASWLGGVTKLRVKVPADGQEAVQGEVYVARGSQDLRVGRGGYLWHSAPPGGAPIPSVDRLLSSAADLVEFSLFGVVLTGMGRDGMVGLKKVREAGGRTVVQDAASSVVFSMPEAALRGGAADLSLSPASIADQLMLWAFGEIRPRP